jgi:hypothetical protein
LVLIDVGARAEQLLVGGARHLRPVYLDGDSALYTARDCTESEAVPMGIAELWSLDLATGQEKRLLDDVYHVVAV